MRVPNERLCRGTEVSEWQMNAWTLQTCVVVRGHKFNTISRNPLSKIILCKFFGYF